MRLIRGVDVDGDAEPVVGVELAESARDVVFAAVFVRVIEIENDVEGDEFARFVYVEAVELSDFGVGRDDSLDILADFAVGFCVGVFGVDADGEVGVKFIVDGFADFAR